MKRPELSVIIPAFGREEMAERAVASALGQGVDLEIILVDDGSKDPLRLAALDGRVTVLRLPRNLGAAAARNIGVSAARANWIAFLDSDDIWPKGSLSPRFAAARSATDGEAVIWCGAFVDVWPSGDRSAVRVPVSTKDALLFASGCWACPGSTTLISRAAWISAGGQDERLRRLEDYEWLLRWGLSGGELRVHPGLAAEIRRGGRAGVTQVEAAAAEILRKHAGAPEDLKARIRSYLSLEIGASRMYAGDAVGAAAALALSWWLRPRMRPALEPFWQTRLNGSATSARRR